MNDTWRILLKATCAAALMLVAPLVASQELKIGVVNPDRLLRESTPARAALQKLEGEFSSVRKKWKTWARV